jgi:hypothetical protein
MSLKKQQIANIIWGLVFIGISVIGGVILAGIVGHSLGYLIGGLCWAIVGLILLFQPATFKPEARDEEFHVFVTFGGLPAWAWIVIVVLIVGGILAIVFAKNVPI